MEVDVLRLPSFWFTQTIRVCLPISFTLIWKISHRRTCPEICFQADLKSPIKLTRLTSAQGWGWGITKEGLDCALQVQFIDQSLRLSVMFKQPY